MGELDVRIVRLGPQRLAFARAFGISPEEEAIGRLLAWAGPKGLLDGPRGFHLFGANDPPPKRLGGEHGYFFGVTVPRGVRASGGIKVRDLPPATYAVVRFKGIENITTTWRALYDWVEGSEEYRLVGHGLEEMLTPLDKPLNEWVFDLWVPVGKK